MNLYKAVAMLIGLATSIVAYDYNPNIYEQNQLSQEVDTDYDVVIQKCSDGPTCSSSEPCCSPNFCVNGTCYPECNINIACSSGCCSSTTSATGGCAPCATVATGGTCTDTTICAGGTDAVCALASGQTTGICSTTAPGATCYSSSTCASGNCYSATGSNQTCQSSCFKNSACNDDSNCCDGYSCNNNMCTSNTQTTVCTANGESCLSQSPQTCCSGTCPIDYCCAPLQGSCLQNSDCCPNSDDSQLCIMQTSTSTSGICSSTDNGAVCYDDSNCSSGYCQITNGISGTCQNCIISNQTCSVDSNCCSNICNATTGLCGCSSNAQCKTGYACIDNACTCAAQGQSCSINIPCCPLSDGSQLCIYESDDATTGICSSQDTNSTCYENSDCYTGSCSMDGTCQACAQFAGYCNVNGGSCQCDNAGQCCSSICGSNNLCGALNNDACAADSDCQSGLCSSQGICTCLALGEMCTDETAYTCCCGSCTNGLCGLPEGATCYAANNYCAAGLGCIQGHCTACQPLNGTCSDGSQCCPNDNNNQYCLMESDTSTAGICTNGDNGSSCYEHSACSSGLCSSTEPQVLGLCESCIVDGNFWCWNDGDCCSNYCDTMTGQCVQCSTENCICYTATDCDSGICAGSSSTSSGLCGCINYAESCTENINCCQNSNDNQFCALATGSTSGTCSNSNQGSLCYQAEQCDSGYCYNQACVACIPNEGYTCTADGDCCTAICDIATGQCVSAVSDCTENSQCSTGYCQYNTETQSNACQPCTITSCSSDGDCCSGYYCNDNQCTQYQLVNSYQGMIFENVSFYDSNYVLISTATNVNIAVHQSISIPYETSQIIVTGNITNIVNNFTLTINYAGNQSITLEEGMGVITNATNATAQINFYNAEQQSFFTGSLLNQANLYMFFTGSIDSLYIDSFSLGQCQYSQINNEAQYVVYSGCNVGMLM